MFVAFINIATKFRYHYHRVFGRRMFEPDQILVLETELFFIAS